MIDTKMQTRPATEDEAWETFYEEQAARVFLPQAGMALVSASVRTLKTYRAEFARGFAAGRLSANPLGLCLSLPKPTTSAYCYAYGVRFSAMKFDVG